MHTMDLSGAVYSSTDSLGAVGMDERSFCSDVDLFCGAGSGGDTGGALVFAGRTSAVADSGETLCFVRLCDGAVNRGGKIDPAL